MWTSVDPANQFYSPYAYTNNPIMFIDPTGEDFIGGLFQLGIQLTGTYLAQSIGNQNWNPVTNGFIGYNSFGAGYSTEQGFYSGMNGNMVNLGWDKDAGTGSESVTLITLDNYAKNIDIGLQLSIDLAYMTNNAIGSAPLALNMPSIMIEGVEPPPPQPIYINEARDVQKVYSGEASSSGEMYALGSIAVGVGSKMNPWIGVAAAVSVLATQVDWATLSSQMYRDVSGIKQRIQGPLGVQYSLRAQTDGYYSNVRGGTTFLKKDQVWKFGQTTSTRYSGPELDYKLAGGPLTFFPEYAGYQIDLLLMEKVKIYGYLATHGTLPAGNRIRR